MSYRGSYVTEYIYCGECWRHVLRTFYGCDTKWLSAARVGVGDSHILAGNVGGLFDGDEFTSFEADIIPELESRICHPMRIAVLAENQSKVYTVVPEGEN